MRSVEIETLQDRLREYVQLAGAGEVILVTDGGRVVAELVPPAAGRSPTVGDAHAFLADLVRRGWLVPPTQPRGSVPPRLPVAPWDEILRGLEEDRADRGSTPRP